MTYHVTHIIKLFFTLLAIVLLITGAWSFHQYSLEIIDYIDDLGWLAPVLFLTVYCLATLLLLPTMVLTLAGGAIFGPFLGTALNLVGATCGAAFAFLISRHLIHDWFSKKKGEKLNNIILEVDQKGWIFVAFLRLFPIIPFNLVNYGLGITGIKFRLYLVTTFVFLLPAEIIYTYFGYAGMDALTKPEHFYRNGSFFLAGIALLLLVVFKLTKLKSNAQPRGVSIDKQSDLKTEQP
ncbi:TVP38/TMEM64 family protein [Legionella waltersii]